MIVLSNKEASFLRAHELGRLATASKKDCVPQVTPVIYAIDERNTIIVATDYGTKKLENLRRNPNVALVVDDLKPNRGLMVQGNCAILERGPEYLRLLKILYDKFEIYRKNPWGEGESPILKIELRKSASWGIN